MMMILSLGYVYAVLSAVIFGMMPLLTKYLYQYGCDSVSCAFYRMSMSLAVIYLFLRVRCKEDMRLSKRELAELLLAAIGFMLTSLTLFESYRYISSGAATSIHFMYPVVIFLATTVLLRQKPMSIEVICILLATAGLFCLMDFSQMNSSKGVLLAFASSITYSFYSMYLERSSICRMKPAKILFYVNLFASGMIFLYAKWSVGGIVHEFTAKQWTAVLFYSLILTVGATFFYQLGVLYIGAKNTSVLSTFEPVVSIVLGVFILRETLTLLQMGAVMFIFCASLTLVLSQRRKKGREQELA